MSKLMVVVAVMAISLMVMDGCACCQKQPTTKNQNMPALSTVNAQNPAAPPDMQQRQNLTLVLPAPPPPPPAPNMYQEQNITIVYESPCGRPYNTHIVNYNNQGSIGWANNALAGSVGDALIGAGMWGAGAAIRPSRIGGGNSSSSAAASSAASSSSGP